MAEIFNTSVEYAKEKLEESGLDGAAASQVINDVMDDVPAIRSSDVLKEDCSTIVGFKPIHKYGISRK